MRKISGEYIFTLNGPPIKDGVVTVDDDGTILEISSVPATKNARGDYQTTMLGFNELRGDVEYYYGIVCPGFVNAHCHLELSHLRDKFTQYTGITGFINQMIKSRNAFATSEIAVAIADAEQEMIHNGIVAVGDIANNNSTFAQKAKGNLRYHTFVEIFNLKAAAAEDTMNKGIALVAELHKAYSVNPNKVAAKSNGAVHASVTAHAPYTCSTKLLELINKYSAKQKSILSIHNQESSEESELFISSSGKMKDAFVAMGIDADDLRHTGKNALQSTLPWIKNAKKIMLVHNTFSSKEDFEFMMAELQTTNCELFLCSCPNANLFIENKLPNYDLFIASGLPVMLGTDSLASNRHLSILDEIKTINHYFPKISLQTLLMWACKNGALFFDFDNLGTIEVGKQPGLNVLTGVEKMQLSLATDVLKVV